MSRFNEFRFGLPRLSPTLLNVWQTSMERDGLVTRTATPRGPIYRTTPLADELQPMAMALGYWADPNDPNRIRVAMTFDEQSDRKSVLTMRQLHPSRNRRRTVIRFGAVGYGVQTVDGLDACQTEQVFAIMSPEPVRG